jgi:hypothetical protein
MFDTNQGLLTDELDALIRKALRNAMRGKDLDRVAAQLRERSGRPVSVPLLRAWSAEARHRWQLPAPLVPLLCEILNDDSIQRLLLRENMRKSLELGESAPRLVALLRSAVDEATERMTVKTQKCPKKSKR